MYVWNSLKGASYTSIDQTCDGATFRDRAKYILDLGKQDVWGDCDVKEYSFTGAGSARHPAQHRPERYDRQSCRHKRAVQAGWSRRWTPPIPPRALPERGSTVESTNGSFSRDIVTGADGTYTFSPLDAGTYAVTETAAPNGYEIDNAGPEYVVRRTTAAAP